MSDTRTSCSQHFFKTPALASFLPKRFSKSSFDAFPATRGIVKNCGSACHAVLPARRVGDHADFHQRLGHGQAVGPHPGRPDSRSPTAMSLGGVSGLSPHTRSTALEESIMTATYTFDIFSGVDDLGHRLGPLRLVLGREG